ncbi:Mitochondrial inner membrane protease atp23 [Xylographa vitiligo]|nr:Mitochondrial inner membrane protease atp23 [Xylographa vitiligo]
MTTSSTDAVTQPGNNGYIEGDDAYTRWRNWVSVLTGKMNEQGLKQYVEARDTRMEEADCPVIRFLRDNINQLGGDVHSGNIRCRRCTTLQSGGFDPEFGIRICANQLRNQGHLEDTLAHGTPNDISHEFTVTAVDFLYQKWYTHTITFASKSNGAAISDTPHVPRFELRRLVESVDSCVSSSQEVNGRLHNNIRNACDGGLFCLSWQDPSAKTTFMRQEL